MKTLYSTTCPAWHDTKAISKAKWLQVETVGASSHRTDRSVTYSNPDTDSYDTKNMVLGKILQANCDAASVEIDFSAVTNFDGSEVTLSWSTPGGAAVGSGYVIYRDGVAIAYPSFGDTSYVDTTVESGETYTYSIRFYPS